MEPMKAAKKNLERVARSLQQADVVETIIEAVELLNEETLDGSCITDARAAEVFERITFWLTVLGFSTPEIKNKAIKFNHPGLINRG